MNQRDSDARRLGAAATGSLPPEGPQRDHFLQLMFFQGRYDSRALGGSADSPGLTGSYAPLRHASAGPGDRYVLPRVGAAAPVGLDSPAMDVMTDLRRVDAVIIDGGASIDDANRTMIARGVRALFVVDDARRVSGIVTSTDILGEKPIRFSQARGIRHGDVVIRDIMTPADRLEILDFRDIERARVGDVVATLRLAARQHALVVDSVSEPAGPELTIRGIFSLTQIARQLGVPPQQMPDIARTFAEIEAAIAS